MGIGYCNRCKRYDGHDTNCPTVAGEPGEQQLRSRIEQLTARVRELEEENARLKTESRDACLGLNDYYGSKLAAAQEENAHWQKATAENENKWIDACDQLAAAQKEIEQLKATPPDKREDLRCVISDLCRQVQERDAKLASSEQLAAEQLNSKLLRDALEAVIKVHGYESGIPVEALSTPASTEALDAYVANKLKESKGV